MLIQAINAYLGFERQLRAYGVANHDVYLAQQLLLRSKIRDLHKLRGYGDGSSSSNSSSSSSSSGNGDYNNIHSVDSIIGSSSNSSDDSNHHHHTNSYIITKSIDTLNNINNTNSSTNIRYKRSLGITTFENESNNIQCQDSKLLDASNNTMITTSLDSKSHYSHGDTDNISSSSYNIQNNDYGDLDHKYSNHSSSRNIDSCSNSNYINSNIDYNNYQISREGNNDIIVNNHSSSSSTVGVTAAATAAAVVVVVPLEDLSLKSLRGVITKDLNHKHNDHVSHQQSHPMSHLHSTEPISAHNNTSLGCIVPPLIVDYRDSSRDRSSSHDIDGDALTSRQDSSSNSSSNNNYNINYSIPSSSSSRSSNSTNVPFMINNNNNLNTINTSSNNAYFGYDGYNNSNNNNNSIGNKTNRASVRSSTKHNSSSSRKSKGKSTHVLRMTIAVMYFVGVLYYVVVICM